MDSMCGFRFRLNRSFGWICFFLPPGEWRLKFPLSVFHCSSGFYIPWLTVSNFPRLLYPAFVKFLPLLFSFFFLLFFLFRVPLKLWRPRTGREIDRFPRWAYEYAWEPPPPITRTSHFIIVLIYSITFDQYRQCALFGFCFFFFSFCFFLILLMDCIQVVIHSCRSSQIVTGISKQFRVGKIIRHRINQLVNHS